MKKNPVISAGWTASFSENFRFFWLPDLHLAQSVSWFK